MLLDCLVRIKSAIKEVARAQSEIEVYKYFADSLIKYLGFNYVTFGKVDWEKGQISLMSYRLGSNDKVPSLKLSLSEETAGLFRKVALRGKPIVVSQVEEVPPKLRLSNGFIKLNYVTRLCSFTIMPIKVKDQVRFLFGVSGKTNGKRITPEDKEILELFSKMTEKILESVIAKEELSTALITDELTGLFNRRYFTKRLEEEFERSRRYGIPLSCCIFDIDNFKVINDEYGHIFGDQVLRQVGRATADIIRTSDVVARYGGEEFTVLFPHIALEDAVKAVERIHSVISNLILPYNDKEVRVTATFGISSYPTINVSKPEELLYHADMALYEGKKHYDKNCIVVYTRDGYTRVDYKIDQAIYKD